MFVASILQLRTRACRRICFSIASSSDATAAAVAVATAVDFL